MQFPLNELEYAKHIKLMSSEHAIKSTFARRRGYEQMYYFHHKAAHTQPLRKRYRAS